MVPGRVFSSLFITHSFVFPFRGSSSIKDSPSAPGNLNSISDTMPSEIFNFIIPSAEILSGPLTLAKE